MNVREEDELWVCPFCKKEEYLDEIKWFQLGFTSFDFDERTDCYYVCDNCFYKLYKLLEKRKLINAIEKTIEIIKKIEIGK